MWSWQKLCMESGIRRAGVLRPDCCKWRRLGHVRRRTLRPTNPKALIGSESAACAGPESAIGPCTACNSNTRDSVY